MAAVGTEGCPIPAGRVVVVGLSATPGSTATAATEAAGIVALRAGSVVVVVGMGAIVPDPFNDLLGSTTPVLPVTAGACPDL
jgi:hypothetical protein